MRRRTLRKFGHAAILGKKQQKNTSYFVRNTVQKVDFKKTE